MPSPTKRRGSDRWYYRRTIPADVQRILGKLPREKHPRNWYKTHISISLGTADRAIAKAKCPQVAAEVEQHIKALREGPRPLTAKQLAALSGAIYKAFTEGLEADPVLSPKQWQEVAAMNRDARAGVFGPGAQLGIFANDGDRRAFSMEQRFGKMVDVVLARHHVVTDDASRWQLIEMVSRDLTEASKKLARNAEGDYSPDTYAQRFPRWEDIARGPSRTLTALATAWGEAALARGTRKRSVKRMRAVLLRFAKWLGHDDARRVQRADVLGWADERNSAGIDPVTINKTDIASLKAIFQWGVDRGWLSSNPAERASIEGRGKAKVRNEFFSMEETATILAAALAVAPSKRENPKTTAAKRWVPWLCAYSGARVMEMVQLRRQDVHHEAGSWFIRLTPEAGGIKTNEYREVPVHEHLIALGFIEFVKQAPDGPLFCNIGKDRTTAGPAEGVYSRIRELIRTVVADPNVQPNHAWRYTLKTYGLEAGMEEIVLDKLCGHKAAHEGRKYTQATLKKLAQAMSRFPRYPVSKAAGDQRDGVAA